MVTIVDDNVQENDETFRVNLFNGTNADISDSQGVVTIQDNDVPTISIDDVTVDEGDGNAVFAVSLNVVPIGDVTVDYETNDVTASAGSDYTGETGQLLFTGGSTRVSMRTTAA